MHFEIVGELRDVEVIAKGSVIREGKRLKKVYGGTRWKKLKGIATIKFSSGTICDAEIHWYEAHGIGRKEYKIKRLLSF
jgi:hypothetical protein